MASDIKLTFLGTGGSWPAPGRHLPALAIQIDDVLNLFDCGEGTQKQLMKSNFSFMRIKNIFITHFHGDHFLGLPGLIQSMSFNGRKEPLEIFGPEGVLDIIPRTLSLGYYSLSYKITVHELAPSAVYDFGKFEIETLGNDHTIPSLSYSIKEKDVMKIDGDKAKEIGIPSRKLEKLRSEGSVLFNGRTVFLSEVLKGKRRGRKIVYTGDTRPMESMVKFAHKADILIHDTTTDSSLEPLVNEYGHSSSRQAAEIARDAEVKYLYLFHFSPRLDDLSTLLDEAKSVFPNSILSRDLMEVSVKVSKEIIPVD